MQNKEEFEIKEIRYGEKLLVRYNGNGGNVVIPDGVKIIESEAFAGCNSLVSVVIPYSVREIMYGAFRDCKSLKSVVFIEEDAARIREESHYYREGSNYRKSFDLEVIHRRVKISRGTFPKGCNLVTLPYAGVPQSTADEKVVAYSKKPNDVQFLFFKDNMFQKIEKGKVAYFGTYSGELSGSVELQIDERSNEQVGNKKTATLSQNAMFIDGRSFKFRKKSAEDVGYFEIKDRVLVGYDGNESEIVIPEDVRTIGKEVFWGCKSIKSVVIPYSVREIGARAFLDCHSLESVVIPDNVEKIGSGAFCGCKSLASVVIPEGVAEIGDNTFCGCESLGSIAIPKSVTKIGSGAFANCGFAKDFVLDVPYIKDRRQRVLHFENSLAIDGDVLEYCTNKNATEITIPDGITKIRDNAFHNCGFAKDFKLETLGWRFENCLAIKDNTVMYCTNANAKEIVIPAGITKIKYKAFFCCKSIESVVIPEGFTEIDNDTFNSCTSLKSVVIPQSVTKIGKETFYHCESLTSVVIPKGITEIGDMAFYDCVSLIKPDIPQGATIGKDAFFKQFEVKDGVLIRYVGKAKHLNIPKVVTAIGKEAFKDCSWLKSIAIPPSVTQIGERAFEGCKELESVVIPESVTEIGEGAFNGCHFMEDFKKKVAGWRFKNCVAIKDNVAMYCTNATAKKITIPEGVTKIENNILENREITTKDFRIKNAALAEYIGTDGYREDNVVIPQGVTKINKKVFAGYHIWSVVIPPSVTEIGDSAFEGCGFTKDFVLDAAGWRFENSLAIKDNTVMYCTNANATEITIPEGVTKIGNAAFEYSKLKSLVIPESVAKVDEYTLEHFNIPEDFVFESANWHFLDSFIIKDGVVVECTDESAISINIPKGATEIGERAFANLYNLEGLYIPDRIQKIGKESFFACTNLRSVRLPKNLSSLSKRAFASCVNLKNINIPKEIPVAAIETAIKDDTFYNCTSLELPAEYGTVNKPVVSNSNMFVVPEGTKNFGEDAQTDENIFEIVLPNSIEYINLKSFPNLAKINVIKTMIDFSGVQELKYLGKKYKQGFEKLSCKVEASRYLKDLVKEYNLNFATEITEQGDFLLCDNGRVLLRYTKSECEKNTAIPDGVVIIAPKAFEIEKRSEIHITVPESVKRICAYAFLGNFESIKLPQTPIVVEQKALDNFRQLTLGHNVTVKPKRNAEISGVPNLNPRTRELTLANLSQYRYYRTASSGMVTFSSPVDGEDVCRIGKNATYYYAGLKRGNDGTNYFLTLNKYSTRSPEVRELIVAIQDKNNDELKILTKNIPRLIAEYVLNHEVEKFTPKLYEEYPEIKLAFGLLAKTKAKNELLAALEKASKGGLQ